ncbi:hypothetical protein HQN88_14380 [Paenibacillus qinlingensis]|nr:hypothetical protein [Paenibacillus qinlingensis]
MPSGSSAIIQGHGGFTCSIWRTGDPTYGYVYVYDGAQIIAQDFTNTTKSINLAFTPTSNQLRIVLQAYKQQTGVFHFDNLNLTTP